MNVLQLGNANRVLLGELACRAPLLPGKGHAGLCRYRRPAKVRLVRMRFPQAEPLHLRGSLPSLSATGRFALLGRGLSARCDERLTEPDRHERVYGHKKQGAGFGHTKIQGKSLLVRGLNALVATVSTPLGAPVIVGTRLRGGTANSARGAASFVAEAVGTARAAGCTGTFVARMDSAFYSAAACGAARAAGAFFSVTVAMRSPRPPIPTSPSPPG